MQKSKLKGLINSHNSITDILLILLVGLLSITWFRGNFLINHGDQCLPLSPIRGFQNSNYFWNHLAATGFSIPPGFATFLYFGFFALMEFLGFSLIASEKIFYYLLFTVSGLSMYYLTTIFTNKNNRHIIGLASALFYMFNFFPLLTFWAGFTTLAIFYALMPLILALYIKLLETEIGITSCIAMFFSIAILSWIAMVPAHIAVLFSILFLYLIYFILKNYREKRKIKTAFGLSIFLIFFYFLLNIWWLIPIFSSVETSLVVARAATPGESLWIFNVWSSDFLKLFRLLGPWTFDIRYGDFFFPWAWVYSTIPFLILGFIPPILVFIPFLAKQKNKIIFFFGPLFLLGLFLMKGIHSPLGQINKWLFLNIPFFVIFRNSYDKFGPIVVLSYAVLIGMGFNVLYVSLKKYSKNLAKIIVGLLSFLIFVVYMWPFWTGDLIYLGGKIKPSARIKVPNYYYEAKEWLSQQQEEFKILSLPHQEGVCYDWEYGYVGSDDPTIHLFQHPILSPFNPGDEIISPYLSNLFELSTKPKRADNIARISGLTNIRYILLHNDINYHINTPNPEIKAEDIKFILNSQLGIYLEKTFSKLDLYKISDKYFLPHIYAYPDKIGLEGSKTGLED